MLDDAAPQVRAGLYLRISLDKTGEHLGVDRQRVAGQHLAGQRGWNIVREYVDNSVSASKTRRPDSAYAELVGDVHAGRIDGVIVWDIDRLTRIPREIEDWIDFAQHKGVRLVTTDGECDAGTENGRMYLRIKAAVSRHEIEQKSRRQRSANNQRRERGLPPIGPRALGWTHGGMMIVEHEAEAIRAACDAIFAGTSLRSIARTWNAAGLRTAFGNEWTPGPIRDVLYNPRLAGFVARKGDGTRNDWVVVGPGTWPAILPEDTWRAVVSTLRSPERKTTDTNQRRYLMSGLAVCGVCGQKMVSGGTTSKVRTYRCTSARHVIRAAQIIDDYVTAIILDHLSSPDTARLMATATPGVDVKAVRAELLVKRTRLAQLGELIADGTLTPEQARSGSRRLNSEITELESRLADAGRGSAVGAILAAEDIAGMWAELDVDRRRTIIADVVESITIHPVGQGVKRFRPDTIVVRLPEPEPEPER
jgi:site-specific DNA recombinase